MATVLTEAQRIALRNKLANAATRVDVRPDGVTTDFDLALAERLLNEDAAATSAASGVVPITRVKLHIQGAC